MKNVDFFKQSIEYSNSSLAKDWAKKYEISIKPLGIKGDMLDPRWEPNRELLCPESLQFRFLALCINNDSIKEIVEAIEDMPYAIARVENDVFLVGRNLESMDALFDIFQLNISDRNPIALLFQVEPADVLSAEDVAGILVQAYDGDAFLYATRTQ